MDTPGIFLKSALLGATDVTDHVLEFPWGSAEPLKLILSTNMATIKGTGSGGSDGLAAGEFEDTEAWRYLGQSGRPNRVSSAYLAGSPWKIPRSDGRARGTTCRAKWGQEVTVHEGETVTIEVKLLPPSNSNSVKNDYRPHPAGRGSLST